MIDDLMIAMRTSLLFSAALVLSLSAGVGLAATGATEAAKPRAMATRPSPSTTPRIPKAPAAPAAPRQLTISIDWGDAMTTRESGLWIGYLFARMDFIGRNGSRYHRVPGVIVPIYDEEVFARGEAAKIYRNLKKQNKAMESPYFNDLENVDAAGFMPEYVWQYHRRSEWRDQPGNLRTADFDKWSRSNLTGGHKAETRGRVIFQTSGS
jgi:hypothetical protein